MNFIAVDKHDIIILSSDTMAHLVESLAHVGGVQLPVSIYELKSVIEVLRPELFKAKK